MTTSKPVILHAIKPGATTADTEILVNAIMESPNSDKFRHLFASFAESDFNQSLEARGFEVQVFPSGRNFDIVKFRRLRELMSKMRVNLVHAHTAGAASLVMVPAKNVNAPMVYTPHYWDFDPAAITKKSTSLVYPEKFITQSSIKTVCSSNAMLAEAKALVGVDTTKLLQIPVVSATQSNTIGGVVVPSVFADRVAKKVIIVLPTSDTGVNLNLGDFMEIALLPILDVMPDVQIIVPTSIAKCIVDATNKLLPEEVLEVEDNAFTTQMLESASVVIGCSYRNHVSPFLLEAMAMGKACLVQQTDAASEIFKNNETAIFYSKDEPGTMHTQLLSLMQDQMLANRIGNAAAKNQFQVSQQASIVDQYYKLYSGLLFKTIEDTVQIS